MARDPRKGGAFDSGMRGREKPKVESGNVGGDRGSRGPDAGAGSESKQMPGKTVGDAAGVDLSAYTSGMRGIEKPKQKAVDGVGTQQPKAGTVAGNRQTPHSTVGNPAGHDDAGHGARRGVADSHLKKTGTDAYTMGLPGNNTEAAAAGEEPSGDGILGEEDDTHINIRIPKASLKKKQSGMAGSI